MVIGALIGAFVGSSIGIAGFGGAIAGTIPIAILCGYIGYRVGVRRHINWNNQRPDLKEDLAHLVYDIRRRICGVASAGFPSFSV